MKNTDLLRIIWFITSSLSVGKSVSSFGIGAQIKNLVNIPGVKDKISLLGFEKMRPPSISQERERLGHQDAYDAPTTKEKVKEPSRKAKPPSKGHYLDDAPKEAPKEVKTPVKEHSLDDSPKENVPKQEIKKSSPKIDVSPETTLDTSVGADSLVTFEEVKLHLETEIQEKAQLSSFNEKKIEGIELPPVLLLEQEKIKSVLFSLSKEKKILLFAGGTIVTLFLLDKLLEKNLSYAARKKKLLKKITDTFKQFKDNLPRT
jgi:hypothetical protein